MGVVVIVLAVTHVVRRDEDPAAANTRAAPVEAGAIGPFLDDPTQGGKVPIPPPAYPAAESGVDNAGIGPGGAPPGAQFVSSMPQDFYAGYGAAARPDPREEAYQRALRAGLRSRDAGLARSTSHSVGAQVGSGPFVGLENEAIRLQEAALDAVDRAAEADMRLNGERSFPNPEAAYREPTTYIRPSVMNPVSEYQVMAGTVLPATMVTAMNSDMPGEILAQISRNIFDSQQRHLLIPRGTKVLGRYENQVALGQSRVLLAWTRLIFPDGRSLSLPGLPTKDLRGASGLQSDVDNHYTRLYGQAALLSIIGAGAQLSQPQQSNVFASASAGQVAAGALGQELSRISMETIRRNMDVRPTLEVKPGTPLYIFLEWDLVLEGPYVDRRSGELSARSVAR